MCHNSHADKIEILSDSPECPVSSSVLVARKRLMFLW